jgi:hypothetical protein
LREAGELPVARPEVDAPQHRIGFCRHAKVVLESAGARPERGACKLPNGSKLTGAGCLSVWEPDLFSAWGL